MRAARGPRPPEEMCRGLAPQDAGPGIVFLLEAETRWMGRGLFGCPAGQLQPGGQRCQEVCGGIFSLSPWYLVKHG